MLVGLKIINTKIWFAKQGNHKTSQKMAQNSAMRL